MKLIHNWECDEKCIIRKNLAHLLSSKFSMFEKYVFSCYSLLIHSRQNRQKENIILNVNIQYICTYTLCSLLKYAYIYIHMHKYTYTYAYIQRLFPMSCLGIIIHINMRLLWKCHNNLSRWHFQKRNFRQLLCTIMPNIHIHFCIIISKQWPKQP